ncbi:MAG TPA: DUF2723 domain-containing protein [Candidatus Limnocylindrales bacterium]|nr:DUF2723 domain-containing protein [Candidatus Limnocylindrales bacterium]
MQLVIFLACLTVYLRTLHPTVSGGDSGELVFVAWKLGVAHAPGYPLYTMLAHAFTWLPSGSIAWRVNLLSAVCDAGAATLLFAIVRRFSRDTAAAAAAALLFAFSPLIWTYATQAEVFALNNLFVALLLWLVLRWSEAPDDRHARLIAFAAGLGLSNHHTFVLVCVPVAAWMGIVSRGDVLRPRKLAVLAACSVAGLLPYLYLPLAARHATTLSWGDPSTVAGFFDVLLRRDYGTFGLSGNAPVGALGFAKHLAAFAGSFASGSLWIGPVLVVVALLRPASAAAPGRRFIALLAAALTFSVGVFALMANLPLGDPFYRAITSRFWQQPYLVAFVLAGIGLARLRAFLPARSEIGRVIVTASAVALIAIQLATNFSSHDESRNHFVEEYGRAILAGLPPNALLLTYGDLISNASRYVQVCEGVRADVIVLDQEMMTKPWYIERARTEHADLVFPGRMYHPREVNAFDMKSFVEANRAVRSIHVYPGVKQGDTSWSAGYLLVPDGISLHVLSRGDFREEMISAVASDSTLAPLAANARPDETRYPPGTWEHVVLTDYRAIVHSRGVWLLDRAMAVGESREMFVKARDALLQAAAEWPWPPPWYVAKNLGLAASKLARWQPDARRDAIRAWQGYLDTAPADEKDRDAIAAALRDLEP